MLGRAGGYLDGVLDEVRIYNRTLSPRRFSPIMRPRPRTPASLMASEDDDDMAFPAAWSYSGNSDIHVVSDIKASGVNAVRLYGDVGGCWGALLHRPLGIQPPFLIQADFRNGTETLSGCHPWFAGMGLNTDESSTSPGRALFECSPAGGANAVDAVLGEGDPSELTRIGTYTRGLASHRDLVQKVDAATVRLSYWLDGIYRGSFFDGLRL